MANGCEAQLALDPKNCGACGLDCLGGKCESNSCLPFTLTKDIVASKIILHSGFLYAGTDSAPDYSGGYVARASTQDGSVEILDAQPGHTGWIDVNDDGVFWTAKGMLYTTKHDGSEIKIILSSANAVAGISVFGNKLAWATKNGASSANMDGSDVYYYSTEGFVGAIDSQVLIDENYVYWFMSGGWLMWGHINAKAEFWLPSISSMILDGPKKEDFFFVKDELGSVRKIRKYTFFESEVIVPKGLSYMSSMAVDATYFYWTEPDVQNTKWRLMRILKDGSESSKQMIAGSLPPVSSLAVGEKAIYWVYFSGPSYPVGIHGIVKPVNP